MFLLVSKYSVLEWISFPSPDAAPMANIIFPWTGASFHLQIFPHWCRVINFDLYYTSTDFYYHHIHQLHKRGCRLQRMRGQYAPAMTWMLPYLVGCCWFQWFQLSQNTPITHHQHSIIVEDNWSFWSCTFGFLIFLIFLILAARAKIKSLFFSRV